jgi:hypothetical protein
LKAALSGTDVGREALANIPGVELP